MHHVCMYIKRDTDKSVLGWFVPCKRCKDRAGEEQAKGLQVFVRLSFICCSLSGIYNFRYLKILQKEL